MFDAVNFAAAIIIYSVCFQLPSLRLVLFLGQPEFSADSVLRPFMPSHFGLTLVNAYPLFWLVRDHYAMANKPKKIEHGVYRYVMTYLE